jgi:hypothetical protein
MILPGAYIIAFNSELWEDHCTALGALWEDRTVNSDRVLNSYCTIMNANFLHHNAWYTPINATVEDVRPRIYVLHLTPQTDITASTLIVPRLSDPLQSNFVSTGLTKRDLSGRTDSAASEAVHISSSM